MKIFHFTSPLSNPKKGELALLVSVSRRNKNWEHN